MERIGKIKFKEETTSKQADEIMKKMISALSLDELALIDAENVILENTSVMEVMASD